MLAVRLDEQTEARLLALARSRGQTKSGLVREAIVALLDGDASVREFRRQARLLVAAPAERPSDDPGEEGDALLEDAYAAVDAAEPDFDWSEP